MPEPNSGRKVVLVLLAVMFGVVAVLVWLAVANNGGVGLGAPTATTSTATSPNATVGRGAGASDDALATLADGGRLDRQVRDRRVHDELRRRILAGWAAGEGEGAVAARAGRFSDAYEGDGGSLSKTYIQHVIREDFFPMAKGCYEEMLTRNDAAAGRIAFKFKIVGDEKTGGILEDVEAVTEGGLDDEKLLVCMRESLASLAFEPPEKGASATTVTYPISFSPEARDD